MTDQDDGTTALPVPQPPAATPQPSRPAPTVEELTSRNSSVDDAPEFVIAMTARWALGIEGRLDLLEHDVLPKLPAENRQRIAVLEETVLELTGRATRHRAELEQIKSAFAELIEYVRRSLPAAQS